jgi:heterodisulfide reductase subunit A
MDEKTGVYVCHCGTNIAQTVDVEEVIEFAKGLEGVALARHYKYMCSDPGQEMIKKDIKELGLTRVVVASCSPLMHEPTFRRTCADAGLNQFLFQMANIREQCSWVTRNGDGATRKAKRLIAAAVKRVLQHEPLDVKEVPINPNTLVVGAGIAGIEAALKIAGAGQTVYLVEREPTIGGQMANFDKTFPTLDCAACILTPKMVSVAQNPNIQMRTYADVESVSGYVGNFKVRIKKKPRYVDLEKCTGCGICWQKCLGTRIPSRRVIRKGDMLISPVRE